MIQKRQPNTQAERGQQETSAIYGLRPVLEAIDGGTRIDRILLQNGLTGTLAGDLKGRIRDKGIPYQFVPVEKLNRLAKGNHQGVVALISPIEFKDAIVRTAECAGADAVVVPDHGSAQIGNDAVKTSSGALLRVPVCRESNLKTVINLARQCGMQVVAATEKGASDYLDVDFTKPTLLVLGAEETGISPEILKMADIRAKLPIMGKVQSLNVSVAAAVFMYEVLRQRR